MKKKNKIKNVITILLCLAMLFTTSSFVYATENVPKSSSEGFTIEDGVLTDYNGEATEVVIPDGVSKIGMLAFYGESVESITIPNTVIEIGDSAFSKCDSLKEINLPDSITTIARSAFSKCNSLKEINLPDSITTIGEYAFSDCSSLEKIVIPGSVTVIKEDLFRNCTNLNYVKLSEGVTTIERGAFDGCENLEEIILPNSLINVQGDDFEGTAWLEKNRIVVINNIIVDADNNIQGDLEIPEGITSIGKSAFSNCENLTNVYIPNSVMSIEYHAFFNCDSLEKVYIPSSVTYIEPCAFTLPGKEGTVYPDNFVLCAETGSYAQQYVYYDFAHDLSSPDKMMSYMPTNGNGNNSPFIIQYYEQPESPDEFWIDGRELRYLSEINKELPIEIINNKNVKYTFSINTLKDTYYSGGYNFYGNIITDAERVEIDWEDQDFSWENQDFSKEDFVAKYSFGRFGSVEAPEEMEISIPLGKEWSGQRIYFYRGDVLNEEDGSCYYSGLNAVVDEDGFLTFRDDRMPSYIFSTKAPKVESEPETPTVPEVPSIPDEPSVPEDDVPVIESYTDTQVVLDVTEKTVIKKEYFEDIVELNKEHDYEIVFHADDNVYITFEKGTMQMVEGVEDYDFTVTNNPDYNSSKVPEALAKENFVSKVIYNYSGKFPAMASVRILVGTDYVEQTLYYTLLNEDGTFGTSQKVVVDKEGYITVKQDQGSSYVITTKDMSEKETTPNTGDNTSIALWMMLLAIGGCVCFIGAKKKNIIK